MPPLGLGNHAGGEHIRALLLFRHNCCGVRRISCVQGPSGEDRELQQDVAGDALGPLPLDRSPVVLHMGTGAGLPKRILNAASAG